MARVRKEWKLLDKHSYRLLKKVLYFLAGSFLAFCMFCSCSSGKEEDPSSVISRGAITYLVRRAIREQPNAKIVLAYPKTLHLLVKDTLCRARLEDKVITWCDWREAFRRPVGPSDFSSGYAAYVHDRRQELRSDSLRMVQELCGGDVVFVFYGSYVPADLDEVVGQCEKSKGFIFAWPDDPFYLHDINLIRDLIQKKRILVFFVSAASTKELDIFDDAYEEVAEADLTSISYETLERFYLSMYRELKNPDDSK